MKTTTILRCQYTQHRYNRDINNENLMHLILRSGSGPRSPWMPPCTSCRTAWIGRGSSGVTSPEESPSSRRRQQKNSSWRRSSWKRAATTLFVSIFFICEWIFLFVSIFFICEYFFLFVSIFFKFLSIFFYLWVYF